MRPATGNYVKPYDEWAYFMSVEEFLDNVKDGLLIDYDGWGYPVKDGKVDKNIVVYPSQKVTMVPKDATHIIWYNR